MAGSLSNNGPEDTGTSVAEQLYHGRVNLEPDPSRQAPKLLLDLDLCSGAECEDCRALCSYFYHPGNQGVRALQELATYHLICRRCEHPHCVDACPRGALEQQIERGRLLVRHTARCVSCQSCSLACPYGTILPELLPQSVSNCDFCLNRTNGPEPLCVATCPAGALRMFGESEELGEDKFLVGNFLVVHSRHWKREKA